jgi:iron complex outermembrane receptor protein
MSQDSSGGELALEEVVVTATKRAESLQDVPISVGVVSGEFIQDFNILNMNDFQNYVPGLQVQYTFGSWAVRIRGLGSGITNLAFDSSVPVFNDGVYCGRGKCMESMFLDVERIEVARGPQGALFGKSTMAGAVNIISAQPSGETQAYAQAGYEMEDGGYRFEGALSGPLSETFSARLAFRYEDIQGWQDNPYVSFEEPESEKWAVRASFAWDATDNTTFRLKLEGGDSESHGRSNQLVVPGIMSAISTDPNPEYIPDKVRRVSTGVGEEDYYDYDWSLATLTMDTNIGEHTLTAILGYWEYDNAWRLDVDGGPDFYLNTDLRDFYDQTTLEVRLLSPVGQTVEYIVGAWYQDSDLQTQQFSPFSSALAQFFGGVILGVPDFLLPPDEVGGVGGDRQFMRSQDAYSLYGQLTWNINDRWRIIGDLRYTEETQNGTGQAFSSTFPNGVDPVHTGQQYLFHFPDYLFYQERKDDSTDPALRVQFDLNSDVMLYAGYAEGSKAGGLKANDQNLGTILLQNCAADPNYCPTYVGQESVTPAEVAAGLTLAQGNTTFDFEDEKGESFEVGAKMTFAGGAAILNIALYTMDFENLQTSSYDGTRFIIQNAASASVDGFEAEFNWQATNHLRLAAAVSYVDATYDDFPGGQCIITPEHEQRDPDCVDGEENLAGERLERSPEWEANIVADWRSDLTSNSELLAMVSMYYSGDYFVRQDFDPHGRQDSFTKWDARVAVGFADGHWEVGLTGRNLTDELTINHAYEILGDEFQALSRGRTITLEGTYRF